MVTVADLVAMPGLGLRPAEGAPALDGSVLRWVATSELADPTPYLEGGELLLTTGLGTRGWSQEWTAYVDRLATAGAAALGLGTGLTHDRLPPALVAACRERGLVLLEVPRATPFVAVSRAAAELLQDQEAATTRLALDLQRRLTRAALGLDLRPLVERLAQLLDATVALVHRDGEPAEGPIGAHPETLDLDLVRTEVAGIKGQGLGAVSTTTRDGDTTVVRPIGLAGRPELYLAVSVPGTLGDPQRSAVSTAAVLLSLAVERRAERRAAERRLRGRALELLCAGDLRSAEVLLAAAEGGRAVPERLRVIRMSGPQEALDDVLGLLEDAADGVLAGTVDGELVAVAPPARVVGVLAALADVLASAGVRAGVGRAVAAPDARRGAETAGHALERTTATSPVRRWEEVADAGPLALVPEALGREYAASLLAPLDAEQRSTLAAFLRHHGSRGAVADDLGVHRNTVRNRLAEIERLTGLDLDDPAARVGAWLALEIAAEG
ncbi:PucR family transcriptional regulator [Nocardioides daeguensis]|uniref:PucR family transcriptional regulator n=1 Tax=Nocardioides daeguensis TaxID=908359 RepID=A0ABP6UT84_9ACTN|nr:PucR family transcriptional regulator [Nocardioides daeguensis]MBV6725608.1 PucR family transcriptional regulator [Nocardioides daeguensis]MCR1772877.1 PucR family transcriptional regulator [Nocardioides daeguensis]